MGKSVTSQEVADKVKALDASDRYDKPIDISAWIPERPYCSSPTLLRDMEAYYTRLDEVEKELGDKYDAILLVGGSGPIVDIANNDRVHALILLFQKLDKPIGAECYGVAASPSRATSTTARASSPASTSPATARSTTTRTAPASSASCSTWARRRTRSSTSCATRPPRGRVHRQRRPCDVGHRRLPVHHRPLDPGLVSHRREDGRGARTGPEAVWLVAPSVRSWTAGRRLRPTTGRYAILEQLLADGIHYIFGNPGTVEQGFLDALGSYPDLQYILTLQETIAVAIADGYARARHRPAVVQLHSGVGLGNGVGMLYQAKRGGSPLVVIAGESGVAYDAMDAQMAADLVSIAKPVTKWATRVVDPGSVLRVLRRAIKIAGTAPTGPVFVALPADVLDAPQRGADRRVVDAGHADRPGRRR